MKIRRCVVVMTAVISLQSVVSAMTVRAQQDDATDFTRYERVVVVDPGGDHPLLGRHVQAELEEAFVALGYELADEEVADLRIAFYTAVEEETELSMVGYSYRRFGRSARASVLVHTYERGTLVVDVIDAADDELVWRGTASDVLAVVDLDKVEKKVGKAIGRLTKKFPPRSAAGEAVE